MIKNKIWASGPKFETDSRGIKRKARMSPLATMQYMGHAATHTGTNSYVGLSQGLLTRIPERWVLYCQNMKFGPGGGGLKPKATGLHLVSLRVDTLSRMLAPNCLLSLGRGRPNLGLYLI